MAQSGSATCIWGRTAGITALLADAVGFAVLMVIDIRVIQDLAITASIGVAGLIITNLVLLPILLSLLFTTISCRINCIFRLVISICFRTMVTA